MTTGLPRRSSGNLTGAPPRLLAVNVGAMSPVFSLLALPSSQAVKARTARKLSRAIGCRSMLAREQNQARVEDHERSDGGDENEHRRGHGRQSLADGRDDPLQA